MACRPSRRPTRLLARLVSALLALVLLSGCAGFSARITIVPSHQAFDLDLIYGGLASQNGPEIKKQCESFAKGGKDAHSYERNDMVLCELKIPIPLKSKQTFVKHEKGRWIFHMTDKSLAAFLATAFPDFATKYPGGLKLDEFDDFFLQVDFPEKVVHNGPGSTVVGTSVVWRDAKQLFTPEGMHAESVDNQLWRWIVGIAIGVGALALIAGVVASLRGFLRPGGGTRSWPAAHVQRWWDTNAEQWLKRRRGPGGGAG